MHRYAPAGPAANPFGLQRTGDIMTTAHPTMGHAVTLSSIEIRADRLADRVANPVGSYASRHVKASAIYNQLGEIARDLSELVADFHQPQVVQEVQTLQGDRVATLLAKLGRIQEGVRAAATSIEGLGGTTPHWAGLLRKQMRLMSPPTQGLEAIAAVLGQPPEARFLLSADESRLVRESLAGKEEPTPALVRLLRKTDVDE